MDGSMAGKLVLITGATNGIGKAAATELARMGATVVIVARDGNRGAKTVMEIEADTGSSDVHLMLADLSSQRAIRELAQHFVDRYDRLDVLINNAGAVN